MKRIVSVGALNVDISIRVPRFAHDDGEEAIDEVTVCSGGQGGNIAAGIGALGVPTSFFGTLGEDGYTQMLTADFERAAVDYSHVKRTKLSNNTLYCIVNAQGARRMYAYDAASFSAEEFPSQLFTNTSIIIFSSVIGEEIPDTFTQIARKAKEKNIKVAMDPGNILARHGFAKMKPFLALCDYFFPSENEIELLGVSEEALSKYISHLIITKGEKGVTYYKNGAKPQHFASPKVKPVDTTGAGDCFAAAFLASVAKGENEEDAIRFAVKAASLSVTKRGARSMPTREEIDSE